MTMSWKSSTIGNKNITVDLCLCWTPGENVSISEVRKEHLSEPALAEQLSVLTE